VTYSHIEGFTIKDVDSAMFAHLTAGN
jgi:hypothetical protein